MAKRMYLASVVFYYKALESSYYQCGNGAINKNKEEKTGMANDIMTFDFRPTTPKGIEKITNAIMENHPNYYDICIVNLIPLDKNPETTFDEDD